MTRYLRLLVVAGLAPVVAWGAPEMVTLSAACPFSCQTEGLSHEMCSDWQHGDTCYVRRPRARRTAPGGRLLLCVNGDSELHVRKKCAAGESELDPAVLRGPKGETGAAGPQGADGMLRVYGDGSAGDRTISENGVLSDSNPHYHNFTVAAGANLTVSSGTVIRCTGTFTNAGTVIVLPGLSGSPKFAENGSAAADVFQTDEVLGGAGGQAVDAAVGRNLLRPGLSAGGDGKSAAASGAGGLGGGNFVVLCKQAVVNAAGGVIRADAEHASALASGGGGGGLIVLASAGSVTNAGSIYALGGNGTDFNPDDGTLGRAAGGGGGGGIIHLIAPAVSNVGQTDVRGGSGGAAGGADSLDATFNTGGGGGGGSGGSGGNGGAANPGGANDRSCSGGEDGAEGRVLLTEVDPTPLL